LECAHRALLHTLGQRRRFNDRENRRERPVRRTIMLVRAAFISVVSMRAVLMRMFVIVAVLVMVFG
jgi:hypothetical protein